MEKIYKTGIDEEYIDSTPAIERKAKCSYCQKEYFKKRKDQTCCDECEEEIDDIKFKELKAEEAESL